MTHQIYKSTLTYKHRYKIKQMRVKSKQKNKNKKKHHRLPEYKSGLFWNKIIDDINSQIITFTKYLKTPSHTCSFIKMYRYWHVILTYTYIYSWWKLFLRLTHFIFCKYERTWRFVFHSLTWRKIAKEWRERKKL